MRAETARAGEVGCLGGFLRTLEIDAADADRHTDAFDRIREGSLQAIIVHDVYGPEVLAPLVEKLEKNTPAFLQTWFPEKFRSWFYGRNLNLADPGLPGYFDEAGKFNASLAAFFPPGLGLPERVAGILSELDRGRPFVAPPGPGEGQHYMYTTLRAHEEGGYIPAHFDNEQALRPTYAHLRGLVELHMTSFVLTLDRAGEGGALEVFDIVCNPQDAAPISRDGVPRPDIAGRKSVAFRIPPGAMIVLDSGRYLHRLTPVQGRRRRWTACSFMALSRQRDAMYCWG